MRRFTTGWLLFLVILLPSVGSGQLLLPTPPPTITAEHEAWQILGEPVVSDGIIYYSTNNSVFFDPNTMVRTGVYRGIPLYQDRTLEPYSIVYIPIGPYRMRAYERPRTGEFAGTVGSQTPAFPTTPVRTWERVLDAQVSLQGELLSVTNPGMIPFGIAGTTGVSVGPEATTAVTILREPATATALAPAATHMESIPGPRPGRNGIFVEFENAKWYSAGPVQPFSADRFTPIGDYFGRPVYRELRGSSTTIWVPVVADGPVAPYSRR